jgi:hypothetical protein
MSISVTKVSDTKIKVRQLWDTSATIQGQGLITTANMGGSGWSLLFASVDVSILAEEASFFNINNGKVRLISGGGGASATRLSSGNPETGATFSIDTTSGPSSMNPGTTLSLDGLIICQSLTGNSYSNTGLVGWGSANWSNLGTSSFYPDNTSNILFTGGVGGGLYGTSFNNGCFKIGSTYFGTDFNSFGLNRLLKSTDGGIWTTQAVSGLTQNYSSKPTKFGSTAFIYTGDPAGSNVKCFTSSDGVNWANQTLSGFPLTKSNLASGNANFYEIGGVFYLAYTGSVYSSPDGLVWSSTSGVAGHVLFASSGILYSYSDNADGTISVYKYS